MTEAERTIDTPDPAADDPADTPTGARADAEGAAPPDGRARGEAEEAAPAQAPSPATAEGGTASGDGRRRRVMVLAAVAAVAYLLDLVTKVLVVAKLEPHDASIEVIGDLLRFHTVRNPGAAFGIGEALTIVFTVIAAVVIGVIARLARKLRSTPWAVALGLLLGGAFGNLTDRVFRSPGVFEGHVVDFIAPAHFAVFNLADSAIVCGGVLIVVLSFRGVDPDGTVHR